MYQYYFVFNSVTNAQQALLALHNSGVGAVLSSAPGIHFSKGCAYAVRVKGHEAHFAASVLRSAEVSHRYVLRAKNDGTVEEVVL